MTKTEYLWLRWFRPLFTADDGRDVPHDKGIAAHVATELEGLYSLLGFHLEEGTTLDEICFANFFMADACPLRFGIRAAGSGRNDLELPPATRRRTGDVGRYSQAYCA